MDQCPNEISQFALEVASFSGRGPYYKGNYEMCLQSPSLKYALVQLGIGGVDAGAYLGVCLPRSCDDAQIKTGMDIILEQLKTGFSVFSIDTHVADYHVPIDWLSYVTITIMAVIVLLAIYSTLRRLSEKEAHPHIVIQAFDLRKNMSHFKIRSGEPLNIMDGVRAIAMMWVVFGHAYSFALNVGPINLPNITVIADKPFFLLAQAGLLAVDVFFLLAGFFLAFVFLREKAKGVAPFFVGVLHRLLRIWPAYILAMMFYYSLFMQTGSGISWSKIAPDVAQCRSMWREVLFISNMIDRGQEMCLGWGWYLQVDFQLFLISLLLLYLYQRSKVAMIIIATAASLASTIYNVIYTYNLGLPLFTDPSAFAHFQDFMLDIYMKPWGRCTPYFMGLILGVLFMEYRNAKKEKRQDETAFGKLGNLCKDKRIRIGIEWFGIGLMSFVGFIPRDLQVGHEWPQIAHSFYWGFSKPIFLLGMVLTILPTMLGHSHSFFNTLLTSKSFHYIARISFCTYLVHLMVLYNYFFTRNYDIYYGIVDQFITYLGMLIISLALGFLLTVFVELPFAKLQKQLMNRLKKIASGKGKAHSAKSAKEIGESLLTNEELQSGSIVKSLSSEQPE